jgi:hypothetical protein
MKPKDYIYIVLVMIVLSAMFISDKIYSLLNRKLAILILLIPALSFAQAKVGAGLSAGISSKNAAVGSALISVQPSNNIVLYPVTITIHSKMSNPTMPVIFEPRIGYKLNTWEVYGGYGYHFAGQDNKPQYKQYQGFKPGAGIIKHLGRVLIVTAGISGKVATLQLGIFTSK